MSVTSIAPFFLKLEHNDQFENLLRGSIVSKSKWASQVDIMSVPPIEPIFIGQLNSSDVPYLVSFPWWDGRINKTNFLRKTGACGVNADTGITFSSCFLFLLLIIYYSLYFYPCFGWFHWQLSGRIQQSLMFRRSLLIRNPMIFLWMWGRTWGQFTHSSVHFVSLC